jgi:hypothetical protein
MWWFIGLTILGGAAILFLFGLRNERAVERDWELLLTPRGEKLYHNIRSRVSSEMALADMTYAEAFAVRELGSVDEAKHLLDVGYRVIAQFSPNMLKLLAAMATFSRMVSAMAPVTPLRARDFELPQIVSLAYLNSVLHQFLVSTSERYRLRLYILGRSFALGSRFLFESTRRIVAGEPEDEKDWAQIQTIRHDFQALTSESLDSLKVLLTSLAAERREDVLRGL